jgi:hypothetical protein
MHSRLIQGAGLALSALYAVLIVWVYATEPRTFRDIATGAEVAAGTYQINAEKFNAGLALFRQDQFRAAREEWQAADPAQSDARTQFYIAYSFYREGWGRVYFDQDLFRHGLDVANRATTLAAQQNFTVEDPSLQMHSLSELKAELQQGTERTWSDLNPLKVMRTRK